MKTLLIALAFATCFFCEPLAANAETLVTGFTSGGGGSPGAFFDTVGFSFTVGALAMNVTKLGTWDAGNDIYPQYTNLVGLWDASGNLLGSLSVTNSTPITNVGGLNFQFEPLVSPVVLAAHTTYILGSFGVFPSDYESSSTIPTLTDASLVATQRNNVLYTFSFPFSADANNGFAIIGPNLQYTAIVPEPSSFALLGAGALSLLAWRRRAR